MHRRKKTPLKSVRDDHDAVTRAAMDRGRQRRLAIIQRKRDAEPQPAPDQIDPGESLPTVGEVADAISNGDETMLSMMLTVADSAVEQSHMFQLIQALFDRIPNRYAVSALAFLAAKGLDLDIFEIGAPERIPYLFKQDLDAGYMLMRAITGQYRTQVLNQIARWPSWLRTFNVDNENALHVLDNITSTSYGANALSELDDGGLKVIAICERSLAAAKVAINLMNNSTLTTVMYTMKRSGVLKEISDILESIVEVENEDDVDTLEIYLDLIEAFYNGSRNLSGDFLGTLKSQVSPDALRHRPHLIDAIMTNPTIARVERDGFCEVDRHGDLILPEHVRSFRYKPEGRCVLLHRDGGIVAWIEMLMDRHDGDVTIESRDLTDDDLDCLADADIPIRETAALDDGTLCMWIAQ